MFLFFSVKAYLFLIFPFSEAGHVLNLFLFFERFEPQRSYEHGSQCRIPLKAKKATALGPAPQGAPRGPYRPPENEKI